MAKSDCDSLIAELAAFEPALVPADLRARAVAHASTCPQCRPLISWLSTAKREEPFDQETVWTRIQDGMDQLDATPQERTIPFSKAKIPVLVGLAACILLAVFFWPRPSERHIHLALVGITEKQTEFPRETNISLDPGNARDGYRYVLFFDSDGVVEILDEKLMAERGWGWTLTGTKLDSAILLESDKPLDTDALARQIASAVPGGASPQRDTRIVYSPDGPHVEAHATMGAPEPSRDVPDFAKRVSDILKAVNGLKYHGYSLRVKSEDQP